MIGNVIVSPAGFPAITSAIAAENGKSRLSGSELDHCVQFQVPSFVRDLRVKLSSSEKEPSVSISIGSQTSIPTQPRCSYNTDDLDHSILRPLKYHTGAHPHSFITHIRYNSSQQSLTY